MELIIIWAILAFAFGYMKEQDKKKKRKVQPTQRTHRGPTPRPIDQTVRQPARNTTKQKGLLDSFIQQLRELEEQERQKAAGQKQVKSPAAQKVHPEAAQRMRMDEEEAAVRFRKQKEEESQRRLQQKKERTVAEDNYALRSRASFSVENLERSFPTPAQRMIVFSEILDKPKAYRS